MYCCSQWIVFLGRISWVCIDGTLYSPNDVVVLSNELLPTFGIIEDILFVDSTHYFVCNKLVTQCFIEHFHSYETWKSDSSNFCIQKHSEFFDHNTLCAYKLRSHPLSLFIPLKYHLIENV